MIVIAGTQSAAFSTSLIAQFVLADFDAVGWRLMSTTLELKVHSPSSMPGINPSDCNLGSMYSDVESVFVSCSAQPIFLVN